MSKIAQFWPICAVNEAHVSLSLTLGFKEKNWLGLTSSIRVRLGLLSSELSVWLLWVGSVVKCIECPCPGPGDVGISHIAQLWPLFLSIRLIFSSP